MPNFRTHALSGLFLYPLVIPVYTLIGFILNYPPASKRIIAFGYVLFVLGADAPDIDHKNAYMHRIARVIVWVSTTVYFYFLYTEKFPVWFPGSPILENEMILFTTCILSGMLASLLFSFLMPRHRGPLHSIFAPFVFGLIVGVLTYFLEVQDLTERLSMAHSIYLGVSAFLGYLLHLVLDYTVSAIKNRHLR